MTLVGALRATRYAPRIAERARLYDVDDDGERRRIQLELLNREWRRITAHVPRYRDALRAGEIPTAFESLDELVERAPVTTRDDVQRHAERMTSDERPPQAVRQTGGSTSRPVSIPAWTSEFAITTPDMWLGRSWYGITPASRLFMLWGHSHLLGQGLPARVRGVKRRLTDELLGYRRHSAYDLRPEALRHACDELVRWRPDYVIGYSVALDLFASVNAARADALRGAGLRAVVATAEAFPTADSAGTLAALFGAPVAMEYGAVETGLIAHTHPEGGYRVFWRNYVVEAEPGPEGRHVVRVTSLFPRSFPLVRYEIGDEIVLAGDAAGPAVGVTRFDAVAGRCNDYVPLPDGTVVHSEAFSHVVRACAAIRGFQVVRRAGGLAIRYVADGPVGAEDERELRHRLRQIHPALERLELLHVEALPQSVAGKTRMVVDETA